LTEVLACTGIGFWDEWAALWGAPTKLAAIAAPDDDAGSGIGSIAVDNWRQTFTLAASAIPVGSTINGVSARGRYSRDNPAAEFQAMLRLGGTDAYGPTTDPGAGWSTISHTIARPGGGAWALADLATLEIGDYGISGVYVWLSTLEAVIDYTPPATPSGDMLLLF